MPKAPHYFCIACSENKENCKHDLERSSLFKFPSTPERKLKWVSKLNLENKRIPVRARVCENHFQKGQFIRTRLRKDAIPQLTCEDSNAQNAIKHLENSAIQSSKHSSDVHILPRPMDCQ
ncbi:unnamed protein product [Orchesella dallaii]|uniref:THAP-type domain-containing protein n=1 Tax=Orchesella dallaii TaxID=48710 RepID=A0ABP1RHI4_9HEXA